MAGTQYENNPHFKSCCCFFFVYLSGKDNINFIRGAIEGEQGMGIGRGCVYVCVCCDPQWKEQALQLFHSILNALDFFFLSFLTFKYKV